jgi:hypothetical protein
MATPTMKETYSHMQWKAFGNRPKTSLRLFKWTHTLGVSWESKMFKRQFEGSHHL